MNSDPGGDVPIDCEARAFTLAEIALLTSLPIQSIRNWRLRVKVFGAKHWTGRWMYSLIDGLKLSVMQTLSVRIDLVSLTDAARVAELVAEEALKVLRQPPSERRENVNILVAFGADGEPQIGVFRTLQPHLGHHWPPRSNDRGDFVPLRAPYLCVPASAMLFDLIKRTQAVEEANQRAEESPGVV
jgi:hypothetical protein